MEATLFEDELTKYARVRPSSHFEPPRAASKPKPLVPPPLGSAAPPAVNAATPPPPPPPPADAQPRADVQLATTRVTAPRRGSSREGVFWDELRRCVSTMYGEERGSLVFAAFHDVHAQLLDTLCLEELESLAAQAHG